MARRGGSRELDVRAGTKARRRFPLRRLLVSTTLLALAILTPREARADLVVIQESNGFPGASEGEEARQKVYVSGEKLRVLDEDHAWALYVRLDKKVVREANAVEKSFVEKPFSDFQKLREDREKTRSDQVAEWHKNSEKAKDEKGRIALKRACENELGLRWDGTTTARTEPDPAATKMMKLVVNDKEKEFKIDHFIIRENEGPPIFDIWVAPGLGRPESVLEFYRELGTFSKPVLDQVMALVGFPVEVTAVLDNGNNKKTLHSRVLEVRDEKIDAADFDVPPGWKETVPGKAAPEKALKCEICGKDFVPGSKENPEGMLWREPWTRIAHPVCSGECKKKILQKLAADQRQRDQQQQSPPQPQGPK